MDHNYNHPLQQYDHDHDHDDYDYDHHLPSPQARILQPPPPSQPPDYAPLRHPQPLRSYAAPQSDSLTPMNSAPSYDDPWLPASQHPSTTTITHDDDITYHDDPFHDHNDQSIHLIPSNVPTDNVPLLPPSTTSNFQGGLDPNLVGPQGAGLSSNPSFPSSSFSTVHDNQDLEDPHSMVRYGRIPQRQPRRYKTFKRVELYEGNFVFDCKVPDRLLEMCPNTTDREFQYMRYTAATCEPDDFKAERFALRQNLYDPPRRTELFIVLTMYNEDEVLLTRSLHGVIKNIAHLCSRSRSRTWGDEGWKKVVVCIVGDGRHKVNSRSLSVLAAMGVYQEGVGQNMVNGRPVTAHIYEYTTQISISPSLESQGESKGIVPVQMLFCLKEKNQKKINSHRWFFNAFAPLLEPNVCVLLDVGTQPGPHSIYHLWKSFDAKSNVGGACGEIVALKGKYLRNLINPLVAAQNFEYKMSNILDKPTESVFGYISVLPGAFSAYRYKALQNDENGHGPLEQYFKGETLHHSPDADLWTKNMYLAEDRILCWELVSKRGHPWILNYTKSAYAITDVPDTVPELISQRRRWLNGSFFAGIHSIVKFHYIYRSDHSFLRKTWLHFLLVYNIFNLLFSWFSLANFYISYVILTSSLSDPSFGIEWIKYISETLRYIYLALLVMCFLLAMGNRPQGSRKMFTVAMFGFATTTLYMLFAAIFITVKGIQNISNTQGLSFSTVFKDPIFLNIVLSLLATYGLYLLSSLLFFEPWHMFTSFFQYLLMAPSMINVINVYAFCNVHDVSWGTKGDTKVAMDLGVVNATTDGKVDVIVPTDQKDINEAYEDAWEVLNSKPHTPKQTVDEETRMQDSYKNIRTNVVLLWTLTNGALVAGILSSSAGDNISTDGSSTKINGYMAFLLYSVTALALVRFIGCVAYLFTWMFQ